MTVLIFALVIIGIIFVWNGLFVNDRATLYGMIGAVLFCIALIIVFQLTHRTPTALDVYRGNTTLEVKYVDGIPVDTVVIFKKDLK